MNKKLMNSKRNSLIIIVTDFDAKFSSLKRIITTNKSKHLLVENELKKLKTFDSF